MTDKQEIIEYLEGLINNVRNGSDHTGFVLREEIKDLGKTVQVDVVVRQYIQKEV